MNNETDMSQAISANYMLVNIVLRSFSGIKKDNEASAAVTSAHHATANSAKVVKDIMAGARNELKDVGTAQRAITSYLDRHTLPWSASASGRKLGARLLPTVKSIEFLGQYKNLMVEYTKSLDTFLGVYTTRVQEAKDNLNTLAKDDDYPDVDEIRSCFAVELDMSPVPEISDFSRMAVPVNVTEYLGERLAKKQAASMENAMEDMSKRIVAQLKRMVTQFSKIASGEKTKMFDSLTENMTQLVELLRASNFTQDTGLDELADKLADLTVHEVSAIKNSVSTASTLTAKAKIILDDINNDVYF